MSSTTTTTKTFILPANVTIPNNPLIASNLALLRDRTLPSSAVRNLVSTLSSLVSASAVTPPLAGEKIALIVILRSGMAMSDPFLAQFAPDANIVVYHLGLFRERETLQPVEYYNKLPIKDKNIKRAYVVDPLIATGGTAAAAISILKDWGVEHVSFVSILASKVGMERIASEWPEGTDFTIGAVDDELDSHGYVQPGVGDIGDRLFGTQLN